jgi:hypothetical protein
MRSLNIICFTGLIGLALFELANVYFIMPMPGSQESVNIDLAYFLYSYRWIFRAIFGLMAVFGLFFGKWKMRWIPWLAIILTGSVAYLLNFRMSADHMFLEPAQLIMAKASDNKESLQRLVIGIEINGEAKAYPIRFLGYHHQVRDSVGGKPVMITYCTVCRTARAYEPLVDGRQDNFRLVGMDRYNAMFEDAGTESWWRQATGQSVAGKSKGKNLPEIFSRQTSLGTWLQLYPDSWVMQADPSFTGSYDTTFAYEKGKSRKKLTGTDSLSWQKKSWVVGVKLKGHSRAYDWNRLRTEMVIEDTLAGTSIFLVMGKDTSSFSVFERSGLSGSVFVRKDTISIGNRLFRFDGKGIDTLMQLRPVSAYQEFWHSWRSFNMPDSVH